MYRADDDLFLFILACVLGITVLGLASVWVDNVTCNTKSAKMGLESSYGVIQGCMIRTKQNQWVDIEKYRVVE